MKAGDLAVLKGTVDDKLLHSSSDQFRTLQT